ncbi:hypothetical protein RB195_021000 [Necator americanus]|uniref:Uncharacterized protein n=1 Tax=Necator americanus TaxID=51031 RepID=A0ABR1CNQ7_NECAM
MAPTLTRARSLQANLFLDSLSFKYNTYVYYIIIEEFVEVQLTIHETLETSIYTSIPKNLFIQISLILFAVTDRSLK